MTSNSPWPSRRMSSRTAPSAACGFRRPVRQRRLGADELTCGESGELAEPLVDAHDATVGREDHEPVLQCPDHGLGDLPGQLGLETRALRSRVRDAQRPDQPVDDGRHEREPGRGHEQEADPGVGVAGVPAERAGDQRDGGRGDRGEHVGHDLAAAQRQRAPADRGEEQREQHVAVLAHRERRHAERERNGDREQRPAAWPEAAVAEIQDLQHGQRNRQREHERALQRVAHDDREHDRARRHETEQRECAALRRRPRVRDQSGQACARVGNTWRRHHLSTIGRSARDR